MYNYDNIGRKIKNCAKWSFIVAAVTAVIAGFFIMGLDEDMIIVGLLVILFGPLLAWVSSWLMYGYGQLIENSDIIAQAHQRANQKHEKTVHAQEQKRIAENRRVVKANIENPEIDINDFVDITCSTCKTELSFPKGHLQSGEELTCPMCDAPIVV